MFTSKDWKSTIIIFLPIQVHEKEINIREQKIRKQKYDKAWWNGVFTFMAVGRKGFGVVNRVMMRDCYDGFYGWISTGKNFIVGCSLYG